MTRYAVLLMLTALMPSFVTAQLTYNIDFNAFAPGTSYTNASGPPNDFSVFDQSASYSSSARVETSLLGLTDIPLVTLNTGASTRLSYGMSILCATSHVISLQMQLSLGTNFMQTSYGGPKASITFESERAGALYTYVSTFFGAVGGTVQSKPVSVSANHGLSYLPTNDFASAGIYNRNTPYDLRMIVNTFTHEFSVYLDGSPLAIDAPFYGGQELTQVLISIGDIGTTGSAGYGAIDNITLDIDLAPNLKPAFTAMNSADGVLTLSITNPMPAMIVSVDRADSLRSTNWITVTDVFGSSTNWSDTTSAEDCSTLFYRLTR